MEAFDAYILYLCLKRHFTINSGYDYFKYNGKTNASKNTFMTRNDRYSFHKLSKKSDPKGYLISNFIEYGPKIWIGELVNDEKYENTFKDWLKRKESLSYVFKNDISYLDSYSLDKDLTPKNGQYPKLLTLFLEKKISIETLIILNKIFGFFKSWNSKIEDPVLWPEIYNMCVKYSPFMEYDLTKIKKILIQNMEI